MLTSGGLQLRHALPGFLNCKNMLEVLLKLGLEFTQEHSILKKNRYDISHCGAPLLTSPVGMSPTAGRQVCSALLVVSLWKVEKQTLHLFPKTPGARSAADSAFWRLGKHLHMRNRMHCLYRLSSHTKIH